MAEKIYCGNAKEINGKHSTFTKVLFHRNDVEKLMQNLQNDFVSIIITERREPSARGYTHSVSIDHYEPQNAVQEAEVVEERKGGTLLDTIPTDDTDDDLPF